MNSLAKFGEDPIVSFGDIPQSIFVNNFSRVKMDQTTSNSCCFCHKTFKSLGNHYKGCPDRNGECYQHLLSKKTLAKKQHGKARKAPCPKCGKMFLRLETHLRGVLYDGYYHFSITQYAHINDSARILIR